MIERSDDKTPPPSPVSAIERAVLSCIDKRKGCKKIADALSRDESTIKGHYKDLVKKELIKFGKGKYYITDLGKQVLRGGSETTVSEKGGVTTPKWTKNIRSHDLRVYVEVKRSPLDSSWLLDWKKKPMRNNVFFTKRVKDIFTTYTGKSLIFQLPIIRATSSEEAVADSGQIVDYLIKYFETSVTGLVLGGRDVKAYVISQSHAIPYDPIAKWCKENGVWYRDNVINIDASQTPELETVDKSKAHIHLDRYVNHIEDLMINDNPNMTQIKNSLVEMQKQVLANSQQLNALILSQKVSVDAQTQLVKALTPQSPKIDEIKIKSKIDYVM